MKFYECKVCGKIVIIMQETATMTMCCGENMTLLKENTVDAAQEKHVPIVTSKKNVVTVTIGQDLHPMTKEHFIQWILLQTDKGFYVRYLHPSEIPVAVFTLSENERVKAAYEFCNLHKLWKVSLY